MASSRKLGAHQLVNQDSGDTEYYTPGFIVEAARRVMGGIDLDPFSSAAAHVLVQAGKFFTKEEDGLSRAWFGRFWMNHPFGRAMNHLCIQKAECEFAMGNVTEGCCITFAATSEKWFAPLLRRPQCYLSPRTNYYLPDGSLKRGVTKGSVVTYFGTDVAAFAREFSPFGVVKVMV